MEELKPNTEHTVANTDSKTLLKFARNMLEGRMLVFENVVEIFSSSVSYF
jgi:hypothetical protein